MTFVDPRLTERRNPRSADIDLASPLEIVDLINAEDQSVPLAVASQRQEIAKAIAKAEKTFRDGGRLFYVGAGTSGRLGVLDAAECPPTFGTDPEMVQGSSPADRRRSRARRKAPRIAVEAPPQDEARTVVRAGDFVVGIAASGTTPYVRGALAHARSSARAPRSSRARRRPTISSTCSDVAIVPITGPGGRHRFHAHEGRHRHEAGAQHDHHRRHDPLGQDVRQPDGGPARRRTPSSWIAASASSWRSASVSATRRAG